MCLRIKTYVFNKAFQVLHDLGPLPHQPHQSRTKLLSSSPSAPSSFVSFLLTLALCTYCHLCWECSPPAPYPSELTFPADSTVYITPSPSTHLALVLHFTYQNAGMLLIICSYFISEDNICLVYCSTTKWLAHSRHFMF